MTLTISVDAKGNTLWYLSHVLARVTESLANYSHLTEFASTFYVVCELILSIDFN